jgi:hypothetical protein
LKWKLLLQECWRASQTSTGAKGILYAMRACILSLRAVYQKEIFDTGHIKLNVDYYNSAVII